MLKKLIQILNFVITTINIIVLMGLFIWSIFGLWELIPINQETLYWKVFITLVSILIFNLTLIYGVVRLYRKNAKLLDLFSDSDHSRDYDHGDIIFEAGAEEKVMYLVIKGEVEIFSNDKILETVDPGGFFGEMAIIDDQPRTASARCTQYTRLITIDEQKFYTMFSELPFFAKEIMRTMSQRLRRMNDDENLL